MSDLISRQAVIDALTKTSGIRGDALKALYDLPSVENKGEWIAQDIHNCCTVFKCSKCGYEHNFFHLYGKPTADYPYCPDCGARMKGGE